MGDLARFRGMGLPQLANKNTEYPIKLAFQINKEMVGTQLF